MMALCEEPQRGPGAPNQPLTPLQPRTKDVVFICRFFFVCWMKRKNVVSDFPKHVSSEMCV